MGEGEKVITEGSAVALDAAVDILLAMYDISSVELVKPIRWLRGNIKKVRETENKAMFLLTFWIFRDPKDVKLVVVGLTKETIGSWQPEGGAVSGKDSRSKIFSWTFDKKGVPRLEK